MRSYLKIIVTFSLGFLSLASTSLAQAKRNERCHPHAEINGLKGAAIVKAKTLGTFKTLEAVNECKDGRSYTIMSFDLIAVINKKKSNYSGKYGDLNSDMKKALTKCKAGSTIVFTNIKVKSGDGKSEVIQGITLHVK